MISRHTFSILIGSNAEWCGQMGNSRYSLILTQSGLQNEVGDSIMCFVVGFYNDFTHKEGSLNMKALLHLEPPTCYLKLSHPDSQCLGETLNAVFEISPTASLDETGWVQFPSDSLTEVVDFCYERCGTGKVRLTLTDYAPMSFAH